MVENVKFAEVVDCPAALEDMELTVVHELIHLSLTLRAAPIPINRSLQPLTQANSLRPTRSGQLDLEVRALVVVPDPGRARPSGEAPGPRARLRCHNHAFRSRASPSFTPPGTAAGSALRHSRCRMLLYS